MNIGVSIFLITLGAILTFAVNVTTEGLDLSVVGVILMVVGLAWLLLTLVLIGNRRAAASRSGAIVEERRVYDEPPLP